MSETHTLKGRLAARLPILDEALRHERLHKRACERLNGNLALPRWEMKHCTVEIRDQETPARPFVEIRSTVHDGPGIHVELDEWDKLVGSYLRMRPEVCATAAPKTQEA